MSIVRSNAQTTFTTERVVDNMGTIKRVLKGWSAASGNSSDIYNTDKGNVGIGTAMPMATLHNAGSTILGAKSVSGTNLSANTALTYTDIVSYTVFNYSASTPGLTLTLPFLMTDATAGRIITIVNTGSTNSFAVSGVILPSGYAQGFVWNGTGWSAQSSPVALSVPISGLTAAVKGNSIDNLNYAQIWNWNSLADNVGLTLASNSPAASAANTQTLLNVSLSGVNAAAGVTTYAATIANKHGYTTSGTNVGLLVSASGGTTNYGLLVPNGNVGIGTNSPSALLTLGAGTAGAAPLKFTAGTNLNTTEAGTMEYNGSHLYFTASSGGTRYQLDQQEVTNFLPVDVTMTTAGTWYTGSSVSLTPGIWLINAQITMGRNVNSSEVMYARIYNLNSSVALASGQAHNPNTNPHATTISLSTVVTLTGTATIRVDGTSSVANGLIKAKLMANGQGNNATMITAVQIR